MVTKGEYKNKNGAFGVVISNTKQLTEVILIQSGTVVSAFKKEGLNQYSFASNKAKELWETIYNGIKSCTNKNGALNPFALGTVTHHEFVKTKISYCIERYNGELAGAFITDETGLEIRLEYYDGPSLIPSSIPYILLTKSKQDFNLSDGDDGVAVRSIDEIALEKEDITWLRKKKYFVVNDDEIAEKLFTFLDTYGGPIAYDTETTGLRINCFGKINSDYSRTLMKWNTEHPDDQLRADKLVGIIFCIEPDVSYYFPCYNRKFKNLYDDKESPIRKKLIRDIKNRYSSINVIADKSIDEGLSDEEILNKYASSIKKNTDKDKFIQKVREDAKKVRESLIKHKNIGDMSRYILETPENEWTSDVILMERVRNILETKHIVAHNGAFEWKVGWQYEIDTNLTDDTMIMHQIMYKFRSTTSNRGESSSLKYLAKRELGIDQWELDDFFPDYKEDDGGEVRTKANSRKKKNDSKIDFSYMDYEGTRVYAPTDGDVTLQLYMKYKKDMLENHKEQEYIYSVEVIVACCIGYMEFYGHRLDEDKIMAVRDQTKADIAMIESQIRQMIGYANQAEITQYNIVKEVLDTTKEVEKESLSEDKTSKLLELNTRLNTEVDKLKDTISQNTDKVLNLASPAQVGTLFFDELGIPHEGDKKSVAKKEIKGLLKAKNEDGTLKYPVVELYSEYKKQDTLMTKFFDNLPYFMYPGGIIFSHFGQISTATGRMSCNKPNAQQYPKAVTNIVIPRENYVMLDADYSQIEYRVLVAMSREEHLAELFADPDNDYHTLMASLMYGVPYASVTPKMRSDAKSFNFGIPYGMGLGSLAILLTGVNNQTTRAEAALKYELYFKDQPKTRKFFDQVKEMALVNRYTKTFWNRYRYYSFEDKDGNLSESKKAMALRQAGNAIIQGTAADVFKISVARNFMYIRRNGLLGLLLIVNMIHDEQLFEVNVDKLNLQRVLRDVGINMQFKVEGFPPLYIGAGIGSAWAKAKGKMAEIHPDLLDKLSEEANNTPLFSDKPTLPKDNLAYFADRVLEFRKEKVRNYLLDPSNYNQDLHPAIGNLLNLQFSYGHNKDKENLKDDELTVLCLTEFIKHNNLDVKPEWFKADNLEKELEEDKEYDDDEDDTDEFGDLDFADTDFVLIDESNKIYGSSIQDYIATFGLAVSKERKICGIDLRNMNYRKKEELVNFLSDHSCDIEEDGAMQIVFLKESNVLNYTGVYVNNIEGSEVAARIKLGTSFYK